MFDCCKSETTFLAFISICCLLISTESNPWNSVKSFVNRCRFVTIVVVDQQFAVIFHLNHFNIIAHWVSFFGSHQIHIFSSPFESYAICIHEPKATYFTSNSSINCVKWLMPLKHNQNARMTLCLASKTNKQNDSCLISLTLSVVYFPISEWHFTTAAAAASYEYL